MKKIPSWQLNENFKKELKEFLNEAEDNGWYPLVSETFKGKDLAYLFEVFTISKDNYIFDLLMLEKELDLIVEFGDIDRQFTLKVQQNQPKLCHHFS